MPPPPSVAGRWAFAAAMAAILGLCASRPAPGLDPEKAITQYTLKVWRAENGLPQDGLTAIAQGHDGALWLGTPAGLVRFDGVEFSRLDTGTDGAPGDRYVTGMLTAADGTIWAATRGALLAVTGKRGRLFGVEAGLPAAETAALAQTSDGTLWLATARGLARFTGQRGELFEAAALGGSGVAATALASRPDGGLWVATDRGLVSLGRGGGEVTIRRDHLPSEFVSALLRDRAGRLWVGTSLGLAVIEDGQLRIPAALSRLKGVWIRCLLEDRHGNLWIGTRGVGLYRLRGDRLDFLSAANGLPNDLVRQILEDRDGALWVATAGGLGRLTDGPVTTWTVDDGLTTPFVWAVHEDFAGTVWVGTSGGGVQRLTRGGFEPAPFSDPGLAGVEIRAFLSDRDGALWIGTGGNGLAEVRDGRTRWLATAGSAASRWVFCLLRDRGGNLWVGTGEGLLRITAGGTVAHYDRASGPPRAVVRSLAEDADGTLWVGFADGLARLQGERLIAAAGSDSLVGHRVHSILPTAAGVLWLTTDGGLLRYDHGRLERFSTRDGLPVDMLYWLIEDRGDFWISSDLGLLRLPERQIEELRSGARARLEPLVLGRGDGMLATECNSGHPAGVHRRDGAFCFATTNGVSCADPTRLPALEEAPRPEVAAVLIDGVRQPLAADGDQAPLVIPSGTRRVEVRFGAIALVAPEKLSFRYRMEGFDAGWIEAGATRTAQFTPLPPGRYRFVVAARRGGGAWSEPAAAIALEVRPAFHQTGLFLVLVAVTVALLAVLAVWLRTRQLAIRARLLGGLVEERTRDLERANAELERLSLADGLTRIANRRHFDARLEAEWRRAARTHTPVSLVLADVDHFKAYNDLQGHLAGDECLREIAAAITSVVQRADDLVARYGGEELAILLPGTPAGETLALAERVRTAVESLNLPHPGSSHRRVTLSLGLATAVPELQSRPEDLIAAADRCLYRAKANGRNRVEHEQEAR